MSHSPQTIPPRSARFTALLRDPLAVIGLVLLVALVAAAVLSPWLAPHPDQGAGAAEVAARHLPPGADHLLGTDNLGRDVLSRIIYGARPALTVPLLVVGLAVLVGVPLGLIAGFRGGRVSEAIMRLCDMFLAFPPLLLAMAIVATLGPGLEHAALALAIAWWPWYTRLVQGLTASMRERPFVEGARALGLKDRVVMVRHILRNTVSPILVQATVDIGTVILAAGSLAFLGLGTRPPQADWGLMVAEARGDLQTHWWAALFPGLAILLTVLAFNLFGDALRDVFDPRTEARSAAARRGLRTRAGQAAALLRRRSEGKATDAASPLPATQDDIAPGPDAQCADGQEAPLLEISRLRVTIGDAALVRDVSLHVRAGEVVGVVGESGCGKSLTALSVLGMLPAGAETTGAIRLQGQDLRAAGFHTVRGRKVAMVFQNPAASFDPVTPLGHQLARLVRLHQGGTRTEAAQHVSTALTEVGLDAERVTRSYPHQLSGGMLQRVMIAAALLCRPDLLIADEPTTALDVTVAKEIRALLRRLQAEHGFGVLYITHNLGEVRELCTRMYVLYAGQVVESGPVADVLDTPDHPYTRALLAALPDRAAPGRALPAIPGSVPDRPDLLTGCPFADRCAHTTEACATPPPLNAAGARASACHLTQPKGVPA
ncbi:dipeptide/oligopeptide/nickel ABC transporter permease/ATP-binding protein [Streptomyces pristinaespiralis]|uniref:dipeptide/oligopeptide/nickel ABC transporter permease/ATP-binding protein n=1 Tax=Streptomyces pristinaespiralis TaxID=38300 RepID=UPI0038360AE9